MPSAKCLLLMPAALFSDLDVQVTTDAPLGVITWYSIGGRADLLIKPNAIEDLAILIKRCDRSGTPLRVLGGGANLLISDEGVGGVVISLDSPAFREIKYNREGEIDTMRAYAGADMPKTLREVTRQGLEGLSQLAGIPGQVGGIIKMNAGGAYGDVGQSVASVTCITKRGDLVTYPASELRFDYRKTNIPDPVIVAATFNLTPTDPIALRNRVKEIFAYKKSTQPLADHSAGCTFKNPIDPVTEERVSAGKLIDEAGLKGESIGGAKVSTQHANFIVTEPGATADDVMQLLDLIKQRVFDNAGLELETEVVIWQREEED